MRTRQGAPLFFPFILIFLGILILLNSFLLIDADIVSLWPLVLILIGLGVLWRGDLAPSWEAHTFGITRGSVESATLEISSGEIDVRIRALDRAGRLIAGQYTARSRPRLSVRNDHAAMLMNRGSTWLFSMVDWDLALAQDLPWSLLASAHLGEFELDLRGLQLHKAHIATGIGDIRIVCPSEVSGPLYIRSTFGDIQIAIPSDLSARIVVQASPFCNIIANDMLFEQNDNSKIYTSPSYSPAQDVQDIILNATFGNIMFSTIDH